MPQASQDQHDEQVHMGASMPAPGVAKREVQVVPEPGRERDVPSPPVLPKRRRPIGLIEVVGEAEPEKLRHADRDVAVGAEVTEDLGRPTIDGKQHVRAATIARRAEHGVDQLRADVVRDDRLLEQAAQQQQQGPAGIDALRVRRSLDLWDEVVSANDGAGNELREE